MARVKKLTPQVIKRIISEEKAKIKKAKSKKRKVSLTESRIDQVTKLALLEVKQMLKLKKIRNLRRKLKKKIASR
jgi:hypothetical protein